MFEVLYTIDPKDIFEEPVAHVHHADCLRYLEKARCDQLVKAGYSFERLLSEGILLVIASIKIDYLREILGPEIKVVNSQPRFEDKSIWIDQTAYNQRGKIAIKASVESKCMCLDSRRAVLAPQEFYDKLLSL